MRSLPYCHQMINFIGRAYRTVASKLDQTFQAVFFFTVPRTGLKPVYRHYRRCKDVFSVFLKAFVFGPVIVLQLHYWVTVWGCSSLHYRGSLGSVCVSPYQYASPMEQQAPWYTDFGSDRGAIGPNVRPPQRVKSLLVGYLHVCDSELYLQDYLNMIERSPAKKTTSDMRQDLSKCTLQIPLRDI